MIPPVTLERAKLRACLLREPCAVALVDEPPPLSLRVVSLTTWGRAATLRPDARLLATVHPDGTVVLTELGRAYPSPVGSPYATA